MNLNYKLIKVQIKNEKESYLDNLIAEFNKNFKKKEAFLERRNGLIYFFFREFDFYKFKKICEKLSKQNKIFLDIFEKIKAIKNYGIKNGKRNYLDFYQDKKVLNKDLKKKKRKQFFYIEGHNFSQKNNLLPNKFENKIICGDSLEVLKQLPDNCIDLVLTSPPYNFGLEYNNNKSDSEEWSTYFEKLFKIFEETIRVVKWGGRIIINVQPLYSDYIPTHHIISNFFLQKKMIWKGEIIWEKNNYNCKYTAWGSWKSPSNPYLKYTWEFLEIFSKGDLKHPGEKEKIDISAEEFKEWVVAKWSIAPERDMKKYNHPAMFPEKLVERVLKLFSYQDDVILDPFNGVGTTSVVAKKLNRKFIGIDISPEYCKTAEKRLKETFIEKTLFS
jgi:DNA modification methylase